MSKTGEGPIDVEGLLKRDVGYFGRYQIRVFIIITLASIPAALSTNEYIFTTARINTRCFIPECETAPDQSEFAPSWLVNAVPSDDGSFESCRRFVNTTNVETTNGTCPGTLFGQEIIDCDSYLYEHTHTVVYDLGLACNEWRRSFIGSARTIGALLSLPLIGIVSDRWGRRTALTIAAFNTAWIGLLRYFVDTYIGIIFSAFAEALFGAGAILACGYILFTEIAPAEYRVVIGATSNSFFSLGQVILGLYAWAVPNWRSLTLLVYAPQLLTLSFLWVLPESMRWYLSKGYYEKATVALENIAKANNRQISEKTSFELKEAMRMEDKKKELNKNEEKKPWLIMLVFKHKPILIRCIVGPVWWITMVLIYYGLSINAVNIAGNSYVNYIVVAAIEIPGFYSAMLLLERIGRKPVLWGSYWICAAGQVAYIFIPKEQYAASLTVYLISKYGISSVVMSLYLYTMEIYPTQYRQSLFSFSSLMGRVGAIVAPLTPALGEMVWTQLPFVLFAGMSFLSGILVVLMPETRGCPLPNTLQEAVDIGRPKNMSEIHRRPYKQEASVSRL